MDESKEVAAQVDDTFASIRKDFPDLNKLKIDELRDLLRQAFADTNLEAKALISQHIAALEPDDAHAQHGASHAFVQIQNLELGLDYAVKAHQLAPDVPSYRLHAGALMNRVEDFSGAIMILSPLLKSPERTPELYHQLAVAAEQMGNGELALEMAQIAFDLQPEYLGRGLFLANISARNGDYAQAIETLLAVEGCCGSSGQTKRTMSGFYFNLGDYEAALSSIDEALVDMPERVDFLIHRVGILRKLDRPDELRQAIDSVLEFDPGNLPMRRNAVTICTEAGDIGKAIQYGAQLLVLAPDIEEYASCMRFLLNAKSTQAITEDIGDIATLKLNAPRRNYQKLPTFMERARSQGNVIVALVLREVVARFSRNRLGFLWAIAGPFAHIGVLAVIFSVTMRSNPPLGDSFFFYYFTGVLPFLLLSQVTNQSGHTILGNRGLLQLPDITPVDLVIAKAIVELFTISIVLIGFAIIFVVIGLPGVPENSGPVLAAFTLTCLLGLGFGAIYATFLEFGKLIETISMVFLRVTYFTSGIFFLPSSVPEDLKIFIYWNPFVHIVDLVRAGYYPFYEAETTSAAYASICVLFVVAIGAVLLRIVGPGMRTQK